MTSILTKSEHLLQLQIFDTYRSKAVSFVEENVVRAQSQRCSGCAVVQAQSLMRLRVIRCNGNKLLRKSFRHNISLWLPVGIWMGAVFWLSAQSKLLDLPGLSAIDWGDKISHAIAYAIGGALIWRALDKRSGWQRVMVTVAFAAAYGLTDEVHQYFVPDRSSDIYDLLCDIAGSAFAAVVLTLIKGGFNYGRRTKEKTDLRSER